MADSRAEATGATSIAARPVYKPETGTLLKILFSNTLLTLVTFGIYRFWAKTRIRRYIWSRLRFLDESFEYAGTAKELFLGFLIVLAVVIPLIGVRTVFQIVFLGSASEEELPFEIFVLEIVWIVAILFLIQVAIYRARRYRLTRTRWRGIVAAQSGAATKYAFLALGLLGLTAITLGLAYPFMSTALERYRIRNTWLGTERFAFNGKARDLFLRWLLAWVLVPFTFSLSYIWYRAAELRYFTGQTVLGRLRFRSSLTGGRIFAIYIVYFLSIFGTVTVLGGIVALVMASVSGIALDGSALSSQFSVFGFLPIIMVIVIYLVGNVMFTWLVLSRLLQAFCDTLEVRGEMDFDAMAQSTQASPKTGEGLADALDVGGI